MSKEYQEQSNEFLIVRPPLPAPTWVVLQDVFPLTCISSTEPKIRSLHRYHLAWLQRQGHGPVTSQGELKSTTHSVFSFVLEDGVTHGDVSVCKMSLEHGYGLGVSKISSLLGVNTVLQQQRNPSRVCLNCRLSFQISLSYVQMQLPCLRYSIARKIPSDTGRINIRHIPLYQTWQFLNHHSGLLP
jgi:hypothetical protein